MKKSIKDLKFSKNVISKFSKKNIVGGKVAITYTNAGSPMTSCNGACVPGETCDTAAANGCVESVDVC
jgi:hypothetical protein